MAELVQANWILLVVALLIGILIAWWVLVANRKTRVEIEPQDEEQGSAKRNQALIDAAPAATAPQPVVEQEPAPTPVAAAPDPVSATAARGDDLTQIKGLGPKLKTQLNGMGVTSFAQIAGWDDAEIDRVDAQLGRFQGRIRRDDWVEQAKLLSAGDRAAYESRFGRS